MNTVAETLASYSKSPQYDLPNSNTALTPLTPASNLSATYDTNMWGQGGETGVAHDLWGDFNAMLGIGQDSGFLGSGWGSNTPGSMSPTTPTVNKGGSSLWGTGGMVGGIGSFLGGAGGIAEAAMAGKQAKLGRDIFGFQRDSYNENNRLQAQSLNRQMQDRQIADINQYGRAVYEARKGDAGQYLADNKITPRTL